LDDGRDVRTCLAWRRFVVTGRSMLPTLEPGDRLLVRAGRLPRDARDIVVVRLPGRPVSVKRAGVRDAARWWVESDNPAEGTDSWTLGAPVPDVDVVGVAVLRYRPLRRAGSAGMLWRR
jgi:signal peptidase I